MKPILMLIVMLFGVVMSTVAQSEDIPYGGRGEYQVGVTDMTIEGDDDEYSLDVTVWYPAQNPDNAEAVVSYELNGLEMVGNALRDALPLNEGAPYPLIVYSHGLFGARLEATHYAEHLASWGFIVIATDHFGSTFFNITSEADVVQSFGLRPQEINRLIVFAEELNTSGDYAGLIDMENVGVTGFSFGGYTALLMGGATISSDALNVACQQPNADENLLCQDQYRQLLAQTFGYEIAPDGLWTNFVPDSRIKAIVPLAPCCVDFFGATGVANITIPLLTMVGTADTTAPADVNAMFVLNEVQSTEKGIILLQNADHPIYLDIYDGTIPNAHALIRHFSTAFFLVNLKNDADAGTALDTNSVNFPEVEYITN